MSLDGFFFKHLNLNVQTFKIFEQSSNSTVHYLWESQKLHEQTGGLENKIKKDFIQGSILANLNVWLLGIRILDSRSPTRSVLRASS